MEAHLQMHHAMKVMMKGFIMLFKHMPLVEELSGNSKRLCIWWLKASITGPCDWNPIT